MLQNVILTTLHLPNESSTYANSFFFHSQTKSAQWSIHPSFSNCIINKIKCCSYDSLELGFFKELSKSSEMRELQERNIDGSKIEYCWSLEGSDTLWIKEFSHFKASMPTLR